MDSKFNLFVISIILFHSLFLKSQDQSADFNLTEIMMHNTFLISGEGSCGTVFILGNIAERKKSNTNETLETNYSTVLITAAHVLDSIKGNYATLFVRSKNGNTYKTEPYRLLIRNNKNNFYKRHPTEDVAVMNVALPSYYSYPTVLVDYLITDELVEYWNINIGEQLDCLGFPLCVQDANGCFPILRTGKIASYPLIPSDAIKTFYYDFEIYNGNSGGPVIFQIPLSQARVTKEHKFFMGEGYIQYIMGLIIETMMIEEGDKLGNSRSKTEIKLGSVIQARYIREALNMLQ